MSLIDIINDRHSGLLAPSEIERRKIKNEEKLKKEKNEEKVIEKIE